MVRRLYSLIAIVSFLLALILEAKPNPYLDSLKSVANSASHDTTIYNALNQLAIAYSDSSYSTSINYWKEALKISQKKRNRPQMAYLYGRIGQMLFEKGEFIDALEAYKNSQAIYEFIDDTKGRAITYNDIGLVYKTWGRYEHALENYLIAMRLFNEISLDDGIAIASNNIGQIYYYRDDYTKSIQYFTVYLTLNEKTNNSRAVAGASNNIAAAYMAMNNLEEALNYYQKAMDIYDSLDIKLGVAVLKDNIGSLLTKKDNFQEALVYHSDALKIFDEINSTPRMAYSYKNIGFAHFKLNNLSESIANLLKSKRIAEDYKQQETLKEVYYILADVYSANNNYKEALKYYKLFVEVKDTLLNIEKEESLSMLELRYESEKKTQELELVTNKLLQQKTLSLVILTLVIIFLFFSAVVFRSGFKKQKEIRKLKLQNDNLGLVINKFAEATNNTESEPQLLQVLSVPKDLSNESGCFYISKTFKNRGLLVSVCIDNFKVDTTSIKATYSLGINEILERNPNIEFELLLNQIEDISHKIRIIYNINKANYHETILYVDCNQNSFRYKGPSAVWYWNGEEVSKILSDRIIPMKSTRDKNEAIYLLIGKFIGNIKDFEIESKVEQTIHASTMNSISNQAEILQSTLDYCDIYSPKAGIVLIVSLNSNRS